MAKQVASDLLNRAKNHPNFGNAGEVENMLCLAKFRYQKRRASVPPDQRSDVIFEAEDFDRTGNAVAVPQVISRNSSRILLAATS
jgi:hypothetical protein